MVRPTSVGNKASFSASCLFKRLPMSMCADDKIKF